MASAKEAEMNRTSRALVIGATVLAGLTTVAGAAWASNALPNMMTGNHDGMMSGDHMGTMSADDMDEMHATMRAAMADQMSEEDLAACDEMHAEMSGRMGRTGG
jgi:hypothetical protein